MVKFGGDALAGSPARAARGNHPGRVLLSTRDRVHARHPHLGARHIVPHIDNSTYCGRSASVLCVIAAARLSCVIAPRAAILNWLVIRYIWRWGTAGRVCWFRLMVWYWAYWGKWRGGASRSIFVRILERRIFPP